MSMADEQIDDHDEASPDWIDPLEPPIHRAARNGDLAALEACLADGTPGVDARTRDPNGRTPLHSICWNMESDDVEQIIRALVAAGAEVNAVDDSGTTAMHEAVQGDLPNPTAVRALLESGAHADPADLDGITPLMLAAMSGDVECIRLLLAAGADPLARNAEGRSAIDVARMHVASCERRAADESGITDPLIMDLLRPMIIRATGHDPLSPDAQRQSRERWLTEARLSLEWLSRASAASSPKPGAEDLDGPPDADDDAG
ncbi:MAG: ankyrin repeat domain-containing protein [Phycisphaerales bacterium]|nr:ankyrin repeat domain-containing protein [Phycisphaerales bacterium]